MSRSPTARAAFRLPLVVVDRLPPLRAAQVQPLLDLWTEAWRSGRCGRRSFQPERLVDVLPWIWIYDRIDGRWFCRLAGEEIRWQNGRDIHRRWLEEFVGAPAVADVQAYFDTVADRPGIGYVHGPIWAAHEKPTLGERLCLPLWNQAPMDGPADGLIGATVPLPDMPREAMDARRVVIPMEAFFAGG